MAESTGERDNLVYWQYSLPILGLKGWQERIISSIQQEIAM